MKHKKGMKSFLKIYSCHKLATFTYFEIILLTIQGISQIETTRGELNSKYALV